MNCVRCGFELRGGAVVCPVCGSDNEKQNEVRAKKRKSKGFLKSKKKKDYDIAYKIVPSDKKKTVWTKGVFNKKFAMFLFCIIFIPVIIVGIISFATSGADDPGVMVYLKQNELVAVYNNKTVVLSNNMMNLETQHIALGRSAETGFGFEEDIENFGLVKLSNDKMYVYFLENYSASKNSGDLCYSYKGRAGVKIASDISPSFVISKDGSRVLYLQEADAEGNMGMLYHAAAGKEPKMIISDIDTGTYALSNNGRVALFIQSYDTSISAGDLYMKVENKDKVKIDTEVYKVFGSDANNGTFLYAKNYNPADGSYDVYTKTAKTDRIRITGGVVVPPTLAGVDGAYILGDKDGAVYNLYYGSLKSGDKQKIDSSVNEIVSMTSDKKSVIYNKPNTETTLDYYVYTKGKNTVKVASGVLKTEKDGEVPLQFVTNNSHSVMAYMTEYNAEKMRGTLYCSRNKGGKVSDKERVSDDAYIAEISDDGQMIMYARDYSVARNVVDIFSYINGKTNKLLEEIDKDQFKLYTRGKKVVYAAEYNPADRGDLYVTSNGKNTKSIIQDAVLFRVRDNGQIMIVKDLMQTQNSFDLYITDKNMNGPKKLDSGVTRILEY